MVPPIRLAQEFVSRSKCKAVAHQSELPSVRAEPLRTPSHVAGDLVNWAVRSVGKPVAAVRLDRRPVGTDREFSWAELLEVSSRVHHLPVNDSEYRLYTLDLDFRNFEVVRRQHRQVGIL